MRTILYSTLTEDNKRSFIGVAKLATHMRQGKRREHVGWYGGPDGESLTAKSQIPAAFRRDEVGTDLFVLGYLAEDEWEAQFVRAVLKNFWPAIHRGDLVVKVGSTNITKKSLAGLLQDHSNRDKEFYAHLYFKAYTDEAAIATAKSLPILKETSVKLLVCDDNSPNQVAMVRSTGMVIYWRRTRSRIPFAGIFECKNDTGNSILRTMEPPQHDNWDPDRPAKGKNRRVKKEIDDFILDCIKGLSPVCTETTIVIPDLSQYLPDDGDSPDEAFDGPAAEKPGKNEAFDQLPQKQSIPGRHLGRKPPTKPGGQSQGVTEGEHGDEGGGNEGGETNEGDGGNQGSKGTGGGDADDGGDGGRTPFAVKSRAFSNDSSGRGYTLIVHPPDPRPKGEVFLFLAAVGDDSLSSPIRVANARRAGKNERLNSSLGRIGPVRFPNKGPLRVEVELDSPRRLALDVTAFEEEVANEID